VKRHLIFDLDGTLVDSCGICVQILSEMLTDRGSTRVLDAAAAAPWMSVGGQKMVAALLGPDCGDPEAEIAEFRARYARRITPASSLFDGVAAGLVRLRDHGYVLSICSNKPQHLCDKVLVDTGLAPLFQEVVGTRPHLRPKPETDLLVELLTRLRAKPEECLFIGDSDLDHAVAAATGLPFLFVEYGYAEPGWTPHGCERFARFDHLTAQLTEEARLGLAA
jgi:phosphoglycolate phosphatase